MSLKTLKTRALQIKTATVKNSITPTIVGTQFEELNDYIQSGNITHLMGYAVPFYNDGDVEILTTYDTLKDVKSIISIAINNIEYLTEVTTPLQESNVYLKYTKNGVLFKKPILLSSNKQAKYKNIEKRRILIYFNEIDVFSSLFIVGGANESDKIITPEYSNVIQLTEDNPYYNITETTKSNILVSSIIENGIINIVEDINLSERSYLFTIESQSNAVIFRYGMEDNIADRNSLINVFYNEYGIPTITVLETPQNIEDYSDITASVATSNPFLSLSPNMDSFIGELDSNTFIGETPENFDLIFIKNQLENNGIYRVLKISETIYSLTLVQSVENLNTIRVSNGEEKGVWFSLRVSEEPFTFIKLDDVLTENKASYISGNSSTTVSKYATLVELDIDSSETEPISYYCKLVVNRIIGGVAPPVTLATTGYSVEIYGITKLFSEGALTSFNSVVKSYLYGGNFVSQGVPTDRLDKLSFSWGENNAGGKLWIIIPAPMHSFRVEAFASKRALENENIEKEYVENIVTRIVPIDYNMAFTPVSFTKNVNESNSVYINAAKIATINTSTGDETKFLNEKGLFTTPAGGGGSSDAVNYITGATSGATYNILKGMNVITNCLSAGTHILNLPTPIENVENLMTVKFRTCPTTLPTITRVIPKLLGVGTISNSANSPILTGVGTTFTELRDGDKIYFDGAEREILSIESDTQITLVNNVVLGNLDMPWEYYIPARVFGGVVPVWGLSEVRTIFYEYVKYGNTWHLEISYSSNAN